MSKAAKDILKMYESIGINEDARPLASSSDKAKYASLKKQVDDLEKQKAQVNDQWSNEKDDKKRVALYDKKKDIGEKIDKVESQRKAMLKKFRGIRSAKK